MLPEDQREAAKSLMHQRMNLPAWRGDVEYAFYGADHPANARWNQFRGRPMIDADARLDD